MKPRLTILLLSGVLLLWLFAPALTGQASFAYRDAAHYYHPLFQYIRQEWGAGRLPLWNPYENLGAPLVAENTSSVFYPGKLLFVLPLDYTWLYNLYIVSHVALAAGTSYALARQLRAPRLGAGLGALAYAFGGQVLFQYCNVIFLVGAAWLPLAMLFADRMLRQRKSGAVWGLGLVLALIVLGGDPQLAFNVAILLSGYAILLWRNDRRTKTAVPGRERTLLQSRPVLLATSLSVAGLLAAIQVLPTLEASPHSARSVYEAPRNVYELAQAWSAGSQAANVGTFDGLIGRAVSGHDAKVYFFSLEPWRLVEFVWPNITGRAFPTNRRWLSAFNLESSLWTPSLYIGLLPAMLAVLTWNVRRTAAVEIRGLSWMVLFGVLGSFGSFGLAWACGLIVGRSEDFGIGGEVGGLYWWLNMLIPGYVQFRYPPKLFVFASLGLCMLAARGWRQLWTSDRRRILIGLAAVPALSLLVGILTVYEWPQIQGLITNQQVDSWLGPLNWNGAWTDFADALLHASLVALILLAIVWLARQWRYARLMQLAALAVLAADLGAAQLPLIVYAPSALWREPPAAARMIPHTVPPERVYRQLDWSPAAFREQGAANRFVEGVRWGRKSLFPKYPLPLEVPLVGVSQTVAGSDLEILLEVARRNNYRARLSLLPDQSILDLLAVHWAILPEGTAREHVEQPRVIAAETVLGTLPGAPSRAWIVHNVEFAPPMVSRYRRAIGRWTREVAFPDRRARDWLSSAVVETSEPLAETPVAAAGNKTETCRITNAEPSAVEMELQLTSTGLVILADQFYPGWEAELITGEQSRPLEILRTNRVMRGVIVPAGHHRLVYRYRPKSILYGAIISTLSVIAVGVIIGRSWRRSLAQRAAAVASRQI